MQQTKKQENRCDYRKIVYFYAPIEKFARYQLFTFLGVEFTSLSMVALGITYAVGMFAYLITANIALATLLCTVGTAGVLMALGIYSMELKKGKPVSLSYYLFLWWLFGIGTVIAVIFVPLSEMYELIKQSRLFNKFRDLLTWVPIEKLRLEIWQIAAVLATLIGAVAIIVKLDTALPVIVQYQYIIWAFLALWLFAVAVNLVNIIISQVVLVIDSAWVWIQKRAVSGKQDLITVVCEFIYDAYRQICPFVEFK